MRRSFALFCFFFCTASLVAATQETKTKPAESEKVSSYVNAEDLTCRIKVYVAEIEQSLAKEADYSFLSTRISKQAYAMAAMFQCLAHHDAPHPWRGHADSLMKQAQAVARAEEYARCRVAFQQLQKRLSEKALENKRDPDAWSNVVDVPPIMKQISFTANRLRRNTRGEQLRETAEESLGMTAELAAIAQALAHEDRLPKSPEDRRKWREWSVEMRSMSHLIGEEVKKGNEEGVARALQKLDQSCNSCHRHFRE